MDQLRRAAPPRQVDDPDLAADDRGQLAGAGVVRPEGPPDHEEAVAEPHRVAGLDGARRLDPAGRRDPAGGQSTLDDRRLARAVRLARPERHGAGVGHEERIEDVDEIGVVGQVVGRAVAQDVDADAELVERAHEAVVLALGDRRGRPAGGSRGRDRRTPGRTRSPAV